MTWMVCLAFALMQTPPAVQSAPSQPAAANPVVVVETSAGSITIELFAGYSPEEFGYAVFGRAGMAATPTAERGGRAHAPVTPVIIKGVTVKQ